MSIIMKTEGHVMFPLFILFLIVVVFRLELLGKFPFMLAALQNNSTYSIMPQSSGIHIASQSPPLWLIFHLFNSVFLVFLTGYRYFSPDSLYTCHNYLHWFFVLMVACNSKHLANFPPWLALAVNWTLLVALSLFLWLSRINKRYVFAYFGTLTIPTWFTLASMFF